MSDDAFGAALLGVVGVFLLAALGRVTWTGLAALAGLGYAVLGLAAAAAVLRLAAGRAGPRAHAGRSDARQVRGPARDGDGSHWSRAQRQSIERHERRHQRAADALGVGGDWWVHDHGGSFQRGDDRHLTGVERAAISLAGNGGSWWSGSPCDRQDEANARHYIGAYPRGERPARMREARALARRLA